MSGLLRGLEVALPEIDVDACLRLGGVAPQLTRLEAHAVERLGAAPAPVGMGVRQDVDAVEEVDAPAMPVRTAFITRASSSGFLWSGRDSLGFASKCLVRASSSSRLITPFSTRSG